MGSEGSGKLQSHATRRQRLTQHPPPLRVLIEYRTQLAPDLVSAAQPLQLHRSATTQLELIELVCINHSSHSAPHSACTTAWDPHRTLGPGGP